MIKVIHCTVNGMPKEIAVDEQESLTDMLRQRLGLTSVKKGCEAGECGGTAVVKLAGLNAAKTGFCTRYSRPLWMRRPFSAASARPAWC